MQIILLNIRNMNKTIRISDLELNITSSMISLPVRGFFRGSKHSCITESATLSLLYFSANKSFRELPTSGLSELLNFSSVQVRLFGPTISGFPNRFWRPAYICKKYIKVKVTSSI